MDLSNVSEKDLILATRELSGSSADPYLQELYGRYYSKVGYWCLRFCGNREEAADLAQEVFLRVHSRLETFRMGSRFSTWLYAVVRSVAINRGISERRRRDAVLTVDDVPETADPKADPAEELDLSELRHEVREAAASVLDPLEAKILYLHYVDGMTLPAITTLMELSNKSGAKAFIVSAVRKLRRYARNGNPTLGEESRR